MAEAIDLDEMREILEKLENDIEEFDSSLATHEADDQTHTLVSRLVAELRLHVSSKPDVVSGFRYDMLLESFSILWSSDDITIAEAISMISIAEHADFASVQSLRKFQIEGQNFTCSPSLFLCMMRLAEYMSSQDHVTTGKPHVSSISMDNVPNGDQVARILVTCTDALTGLNLSELCESTKDGILVHKDRSLSPILQKQRALYVCKAGMGLMNRIEQAHSGIINSMAKSARKMLVDISEEKN